MGSKSMRTLAVGASAALVLGAFVAAPAEAKKKKCGKYAAPSWAGDAETTTVTDAATADAPISIELTTGPALGFTNANYPGDETGSISHVFQNVIVDTKAKSANLFARAEYLPSWDYDLFLRIPAGPSVAYEADFNPLTAGGPTPVGGTEGGHAEPGVSQIDGYPVPDCLGYTVDVASSITPGGAVTLLLWLEK
jgi:hypothetical protein